MAIATGDAAKLSYGSNVASKTGCTMYVISHTHWDREWYMPFQSFRIRLVDMIDKLLEILDREPDFKCFNLDGQTIVLEDYLQIRPEKKSIIERYVREGRIIIGPWYQLNDEFLVSGEATIRSLLIGHKIASEFGKVMKLGYLPDQFGSISQMPQILKGFGIESAIVGRGRYIKPGKKMEFIWKSPDGSQVLASYMAYWYNNAQRFPKDINAALEFTNSIQERLKELSYVDHLLLMNGVDHLEAQGNVGEIINELNKRLDKGKLVHSTLPAYMNAVRDALDESGTQVDIVDSELRQGSKEVMLAGTLSSRMYIKQANEVCQTELEKYTEPTSTFARMLGFAYPKSFLDYTWKLLMQNHPHDSICGCSVDQVHREMMPRFDQVQQVAGELTQRALANISQCINTSGDALVVYNPLNWARTDKVTAIIDFPLGEEKRENPTEDPELDVKAIRIVDNHGVSVPFAVISNNKIAKNVYSPIELPMVQIARRFVIEFVAEGVSSCGYKTYSVEKCDQWPSWQDSFAPQFAAEEAISNEFVKLSTHEGLMRLERLQPSVEGGACDVYDDINVFEDTGDAGDEYIYVKPNSDFAVTSRCSNIQVSLASHNPISATLKVSCTMRIPRQSDTSGRSDGTVECPITSYMTITHGIPRVNIKTQIDNQASNHRLRVLFPTGIDTDVSHAEGQLDVLTRPIHSQYTANGDSEPQPQQRWMDVCNEQRGLCVINKGLPEYEVYTDDARTIALTLLRCVGHMSHNDDMPGSLETPEAQCIGTHSFEYALYPHSGSWDSAQVWRQAHQHNIPLMVTQTSAHQGCLPACHTFLEISNTGLVISSVKMAENCEDRVIVRLYNTTSNTINDVHVRIKGARCAHLLNLNEEIIGNAHYEDDAVVLSAGAKEIVTLGFDLTK